MHWSDVEPAAGCVPTALDWRYEKQRIDGGGSVGIGERGQIDAVNWEEDCVER